MTVRQALGAFGAQAMIAGLSRFTKTTFLTYGIGLLPFSCSTTGSMSSIRSSPGSACSTPSVTW